MRKSMLLMIGGECLDPISLFTTGVVVGIYCWNKAKEIKREGE